MSGYVAAITDAIPPPADRPLTYTRPGSTLYVFSIRLVTAAIRAASPPPRCMLASAKKFQQPSELESVSCSGNTTMKPLASASVSQRVSCRKLSAVCVQPCNATTNGTAVAGEYDDGTYNW